MTMPGRKILITGNIGSGKTTLCRKVSAILGIPAYHFDQIAWKENWQRPSPEERKAMTDALIGKGEWVIDAVSKELMQEADTIVFLDVPRRVSFWRVLKRNVQHGFRTRPEMPEGCPDIKQLPFIIRIIWTFRQKQNPWILEGMENMKDRKKVVHIRNNVELHEYMNSMEA